jgi:uncharacterized protein (DUF2252 family)
MTLPPPQERAAAGRHQRKHMRRTDHAGWNPKLRTEAPIKLLQASVRGRVPSLIPIKNERMSASPFTYFRGAVPVMAYDLSLSANTGIHTRLCGDAHVLNLGAYEAPDGRLVFDINDFDESLPGPFEWDVKRMATSLILAGWDAGARNSHCHEAVAVFLEAYRRSILRFARMPVLELARYQVHRLGDLAPMTDIFALARRATPIHNLKALTEPAHSPANVKAPASKAKHTKDASQSDSDPVSKPNPGSDERSFQRSPGEPRIFKTNEPVLKRITGKTAQRVLDSLTTYTDSLQPERRHFLAQYTPIDVAFKVVGTGSVGLRDYCIYMEANGPRDPLFLQIKEEVVSAFAPYLGHRRIAPRHEGQRVVEGQRAMQLQSDPFLGWTSIEGRDYLVRQLNDHKAAIDLRELKAAGLLEYAAVCGEILARGHARAGDPLMLAGYIGNSTRFDVAITRFAIAYSDQTEADWKHFVHATKTTAKPEPKPKPKPKRRSKTKS